MKSKVLFLLTIGVLSLASSCRKQQCPAYGKVSKPATEKRDC